MEMLDDLIHNIIPVIGSKFAENWDFGLLNKNLKTSDREIWGHMNYTADQMRSQHLKNWKMLRRIPNYTLKNWNRSGTYEEVEKMILLRVVDNRWMDHNDAIDE